MYNGLFDLPWWGYVLVALAAPAVAQDPRPQEPPKAEAAPVPSQAPAKQADISPELPLGGKP